MCANTKVLVADFSHQKKETETSKEREREKEKEKEKEREGERARASARARVKGETRKRAKGARLVGAFCAIAWRELSSSVCHGFLKTRPIKENA